MIKINKLCIILLLPFCMGASYTDPTRPPESILSHSEKKGLPASAHTLSLTAIFIYQHYQIAIINNQAVRTGDRISEYVVTSISKDAVELTGANDDRILLRLTPSVKQAI